MKYPVGTIFRPPTMFNWCGEVMEHENGKYRIKWSDGYGNAQRYSEERMEEIIKISHLTWTLPYTINHDFDEDLFEL